MTKIMTKDDSDRLSHLLPSSNSTTTGVDVNAAYARSAQHSRSIYAVALERISAGGAMTYRARDIIGR